jgi:hypothetical protein
MIKLEMSSVRKVDNKVYQFFNSDAGIKEYIKTNFQDTGKLVSMSNSISDDHTTETRTLVFNSQEDYVDFLNDKVLQYQTVLQTRYNRYHNITFDQFTTII